MRVSSTRPYPDLEAGLIEWASSHPDLSSPDPATKYRHVGDELPSRYRTEGRLPFLEISVRGGREDGVTWFAETEFFIFSPDREQARNVLADVFAKLGVYPRNFGGISVDEVQVTVYPRRSKNQEPDDATFCYSGEAIISLRRQKGN